ncbi:MAG: hypothetical protein IIA66_08220 [Planctomycetes bacterium]|nr:hypothetical protein [Planctomycetota bacterium]
MGKSNQSAKTNQTQAHHDPPPAVGLWPEPAPKWGLWATAALWLAWGAFLVWMMVLKMAQT